ncbi:MAG: hypothetical protein TR69_WS6001000846 [candidate division WS6 bacterium OLB20]|uniref:DUF1761 domain-containing protein n=1 Tax=candidate division WS6 bacterium OLB20 TaxID=1617426 RepID=A0A136LYV3_9BACT|nr:MAG: hypothetical protein TR69_WS6001000846 [candidate division WS6 bacterium OLB20]
MESLITFQLNWVAVIGAAVFSMILGFIWYAEPVFGKAWMKELGFKKSDLNPNPVIYLFTFLGALLTSFILANVILLVNANTIVNGALVGLMFGLVFLTGMMMSFAFEKRTMRHFLIDSMYQVVYLTLIGGMFGSFLFN